MPPKKLGLMLSIPIISYVVKQKIKKEMGLDQARFSFCGAAAISKDLLVWFDKLGIKIHEVYGMTENFGITSVNLPGKTRFGTVGSVWPNTKVMISAEGEILTKSEANMLGYYKQPEQTAEMIDKNGWLHTGDKGELSKDGYLKITGRIKDLFKTSKGKYVSPSQLEGFFTMSNLVEQVCVLGSGLSQPIALIILSDLGKKAEHEYIQQHISELLKYVNHKVDAHERLDHIVVLNDDWSVESGILTPTLKIKRNVIEKMYEPKINKWLLTKDFVIFNS
jgi:long-chain acyl-CoA synthetase